jgi:peptidoglycan/LPS O-acetylase OafA/YrhL
LLTILAYHFGVPGVSGGFFSLDIFYVLSGYLITGLLLGEIHRHDRIAFAAFWLRRARRLLPALCAMLVVVALAIWLVEPPGMFPSMRAGALSTLFYFSNWFQIATSNNYFTATTTPSPLMHTWSLSVEEQFYLIWPIIVGTVLYFTRRRHNTAQITLVVSLVGLVSSAIAMAIMYHHGANPTRLYFGTDTHAQSLLVGCALACILTLTQQRRGRSGMAPTASSPNLSRLLAIGGVIGLVAILVLDHTLTGTSSLDYQGGFLISALAAAALVTSVVTVPSSLLSRALSTRTLVWIGTVSYGAYLWHFPVFVLLDPTHTHLAGLPLLTARVLLTFAIAALSWYAIERPVLENHFWRTASATVPALLAIALTVVVIFATTQTPPARPLPPHIGYANTPKDAALNARLTAIGAYHAHPLRYLFVGDSLAVTMSPGLSSNSIPDYGVSVVDRAVLGCDYDTSQAFWAGMLITPTSPCRNPLPLYKSYIARTHPDVIGLLIGRWSTTDRMVDGQRIHIGQPLQDARLRAQYAPVLNYLTSTHIPVVVFTLPCVDPPFTQADGTPWPEDQPPRVTEFNQLLTNLAAHTAPRPHIFDLGPQVCPSGKYTPDLDGVTIRRPDGIHFTYPGGQLLQHSILPLIADLGAAHRTHLPPLPIPPPLPAGQFPVSTTAFAPFWHPIVLAGSRA